MIKLVIAIVVIGSCAASTPTPAAIVLRNDSSKCLKVSPPLPTKLLTDYFARGSDGSPTQDELYDLIVWTTALATYSADAWYNCGSPSLP